MIDSRNLRAKREIDTSQPERRVTSKLGGGELFLNPTIRMTTNLVEHIQRLAIDLAVCSVWLGIAGTRKVDERRCIKRNRSVMRVNYAS